MLAWPLPNGGPARELATLGDNEAFVGWSADPARIYVAAWNGPKARIDSLDVATGRRAIVREITVDDPAGMLTVPDLYLSADAQSYVYGSARMLSTLTGDGTAITSLRASRDRTVNPSMNGNTALPRNHDELMDTMVTMNPRISSCPS